MWRRDVTAELHGNWAAHICGLLDSLSGHVLPRITGPPCGNANFPPFFARLQITLEIMVDTGPCRIQNSYRRSSRSGWARRALAIDHISLEVATLLSVTMSLTLSFEMRLVFGRASGAGGEAIMLWNLRPSSQRQIWKSTKRRLGVSLSFSFRGGGGNGAQNGTKWGAFGSEGNFSFARKFFPATGRGAANKMDNKWETVSLSRDAAYLAPRHCSRSLAALSAVSLGSFGARDGSPLVPYATSKKGGVSVGTIPAP